MSVGRVVVGLYLVCASQAYGACFDIDQAQPAQLEGRLTRQVFAGRPNYESVKRGDEPEITYILNLQHPICIKGYSTQPFSTVHLVYMDSTRSSMKALVGQDVRVGLTEQMEATTGHHHAPLVAWVQDIQRVQKAKQ